jgi:hypothetical protein
MKKILNIFLSLLVLLTIACNRTTNLTFSDFDTNSNNSIEKEEFMEVFTNNFYNDWNNDDNQYLDDEDFYLSVYDIWDTDNDMLLSKDEWFLGYDYYYGDFILTNYDAIDLDGDGLIDYNEYTGVLRDTEFYTQWDIDASEYLSEEELAAGVFNIWDIDNSNALELDEYTEFDLYYLDI